mmetsp:Transcript_27095/g.42380  ORF Transcript_27095/g.42380 Transcript_27095/m.42380 type:complete len:161 (-) Transcript_27095:138-620(-)
MSGVEAKAAKWFGLCDAQTSGKISKALATNAEMRIAHCVGNPPEKSKFTGDTEVQKFVQTIANIATGAQKDAEVEAELDVMCGEVEALGPPPLETGDPVKDMHSYRTYHGLDRVLGFLLQDLVMKKPDDPVKALKEKVESLNSFATLKAKMGDKPYHGNL